MSATTVVVGTDRSPGGTDVPISMVQDGLDRLWREGSVRVSVPELGYRSAFVGAVLASLPGAVVATDPATVSLTPVTDVQRSLAPSFAVLDREAVARYRMEQGVLRARLLGGREVAACALCGHDFPGRFLVAAHIKQRSACTDDERRDLDHVAMLACSFGCDALYERGYLAVDEDGRVLVAGGVTGGVAVVGETPPGRFADHLDLVRGNPCGAHDADSAGYFRWHRQHRYRDAEPPTA